MKRNSRLKLNIISRVATPHNNDLLKELSSRTDVELNLYYAVKSSQEYSWKDDLSNAISHSYIFGERFVNFKLLWYALSHSKEKYLLVGWTDPTSCMIILLFWIFRRPFTMWFDYPDDEGKKRSFLKAFLRNCFFYMVKTGTSNVFVVGEHTKQYFLNRGFVKGKLVNLPIFINIDKTIDDFIGRRDEIRSKYSNSEYEIIFITGSRLVYDKGYDLLVKSVSLLDRKLLNRARFVIIGQGPEEESLRKLINHLSLNNRIILEPWMELDELKATISASDVYIHPARFDAFGGGTLHAMALGLPVIGSDGAGAAIERVTHGVNGFIYPCEDTSKLAEYIAYFLNNPQTTPIMGKNARKTAEEWSPKRGADILIEAISSSKLNREINNE